MPPHRSRTASSNQSHGWSDAPLAAHAPSRSTRLSIHDSVDATLGARNAIGEKGRRHYDFPGIVSSEKIPPRERVRSLLRARIHSPYRPLCLVHFKSCAHIVDGNKASRLPVETDAPREGSIAGATRHLQRAHHVKLASHELKHALGEPSFASYSQHQRGHGKPPVAAGWNGRTNDPPPPDRRAASTLSSSASQAALLLRRLPAHPIDPCAKCRGSKRARLAAFCAHTACQLKKKGRADHSGRHGIMKKGVGGSEIAAGSTRHSHPSPPLGIGEHQHSFAALCGPHHDLSAMLTPAHQVDLHQRATRAFPFRFSQPTLRNAPLAHSLFAFRNPRFAHTRPWVEEASRTATLLAMPCSKPGSLLHRRATRHSQLSHISSDRGASSSRSLRHVLHSSRTLYQEAKKKEARRSFCSDSG